MIFIAQAVLFALALVVDSARIIDLPIFGGIHPLLFSAIVVSFAVSSGAFTGGLWGFIGGLSLGLFAGTAQVGALALGGFLSGSMPVLLRPLVFWRKWTSQVVLGFASVLLFNATIYLVSALQGVVSGFSWMAVLRLAFGALLTAVICPPVCAGMSRLESRH